MANLGGGNIICGGPWLKKFKYTHRHTVQAKSDV